MGSNRLKNAYNGWGLTAGEWRQDAPRVDGVLMALSQMLNPKQQFEMDDLFHLAWFTCKHVHGQVVVVNEFFLGSLRPRNLKKNSQKNRQCNSPY